MKPIFITGIGTDVGKTICSAILVAGLRANYWKPVQTGAVSDTETIKALVSNSVPPPLPGVYALREPLSPHAAAELEGVRIDLTKIVRFPPFLEQSTNIPLIVEGAGGLLVPLNEKDLMVDLIAALGAQVIIVSRNYLGSINHSLLTIAALQQRSIPMVGILFNGPPTPSTEDIILHYTGIRSIGRIDWEESVDQDFVRRWAEIITPSLRQALSGQVS